MAKSKGSALEKPVRVADDEDEATLQAIDEGIADTKSGRTVAAKKVRELLPKWISSSSSRKER